MAKLLICIGFLLTFTRLSTGDDGNSCPVNLPCTCSKTDREYLRQLPAYRLIHFPYIVPSRFVDCINQNLKELPPVTKTSQEYDIISFYNNFITRVEDGYFSSLSFNSRDLIIDLSYNRINYIGQRAFQGLENATLSISLEHNDIVSLPSAFLELNHLEQLVISGVRTFSPDVIEHIGKTLRTFAVGELTEWPQELRSLKTLQLILFRLRMSKLSVDDVASLPLRLLTIQDSSFQEPLDGLCGLQTLNWITLLNLTAPFGVELFPKCETPMKTVTGFIASNIYMPNVSHILEIIPSVGTVKLNVQGLKSLTLPAKNTIYYLYLTSIPLETFSLTTSKSETLQVLSITGSKITSIKTNDLRNFPKLRKLDMINNPLTSISEDAFENNKVLGRITISGSNLTSMPKAITRLHDLSSLTLYDNPIRCSCDMAWLQGWPRFKSVNIEGDCQGSPGELSNYTKHKLDDCVRNPVVG